MVRVDGQADGAAYLYLVAGIDSLSAHQTGGNVAIVDGVANLAIQLQGIQSLHGLPDGKAVKVGHCHLLAVAGIENAGPICASNEDSQDYHHCQHILPQRILFLISLRRLTVLSLLCRDRSGFSAEKFLVFVC